MDAVETGTIILVAVIIGGLVFGVIAHWNYDKSLEDTKELFDIKPYDENLEHVAFADLATKVSEFKEFAKRTNSDQEKTIYLKDSIEAGKEDFFEIVKEVHFCNVLASRQLQCGDEEAFTYFSKIEGPAIIIMEYQDGKLSLYDIKYPPPVCGNSVLEDYGGEECDDGNTASGDGCSSECRLEYCGDAITTTTNPNNHYILGNVFPEECDDGNLNNMDACTTECKNATCGDGYLWLGVEECDDKNVANNDGCSSVCTVEPGYHCYGIPSTCVLAHQPGLKSRYYSYQSPTPHSVYTDMANVQYLQPAVSRIDSVISISPSSNWPDGQVTTWLLLISEGLFKAETAGEYTFYLESRAGSALFVGDEILIDDHYYARTNMVKKGETITLQEGYVPIKIVMFRIGGYGGIHFRFQGPDYPAEQIVPANLLSHAGVP